MLYVNVNKKKLAVGVFSVQKMRSLCVQCMQNIPKLFWLQQIFYHFVGVLPHCLSCTLSFPFNCFRLFYLVVQFLSFYAFFFFSLSLFCFGFGRLTICSLDFCLECGVRVVDVCCKFCESIELCARVFQQYQYFNGHRMPQTYILHIIVIHGTNECPKYTCTHQCRRMHHIIMADA